MLKLLHTKYRSPLIFCFRISSQTFRLQEFGVMVLSGNEITCRFLQTVRGLFESVVNSSKVKYLVPFPLPYIFQELILNSEVWLNNINCYKRRKGYGWEMKVPQGKGCTWHLDPVVSLRSSSDTKLNKCLTFWIKKNKTHVSSIFQVCLLIISIFWYFDITAVQNQVLLYWW